MTADEHTPGEGQDSTDSKTYRERRDDLSDGELPVSAVTVETFTEPAEGKVDVSRAGEVVKLRFGRDGRRGMQCVAVMTRQEALEMTEDLKEVLADMDYL